MVIRKFNVYAKFHQKRDFVPEISWFETRRVIVEKDFSQTAYYYGQYKDGSYRWRESLYAEYHYDFEGNKGTLYQRTLFSLNQGNFEDFRVIRTSKEHENGRTGNVLLYRYHCPAIEKAAKAGLKKFVIQSIHKKSRLPKSQKTDRKFWESIVAC